LSEINKKELSETDICDLYISPAIKDAGWDPIRQIRREVTLTPGPIVVRGNMSSRNKKKKKFADYVLSREPGVPVAVVEAKDTHGPAGPRAMVIRSVFEDAYNYMKSGTLMRQAINKICEIDFNTQKDRHTFGNIYEQILKDLQCAGNAGEFYTPRAVTQFIVNRIDPKLDEIVLDPACGTGGFLAHTIQHKRECYLKKSKHEEIQQKTIRGVDKKALPHMLCVTNMILQGIDTPTEIRHDNTLSRPLRDYTNKDRVHVIVTNPPFGGMEEDGIENNFPAAFRTRETADLFVTLIIHLLRENGRAAVVLPDGFFFGEGIARQGAGGAQPNISKVKIENTTVPLPPTAEQHRIVTKVYELMALCDQLEQQQTDSNDTHQTLVSVLLAALTSAADAKESAKTWQRITDHFDTLFTTEASIDKLKQTILQLAVMGKLVPQGHNDEPASALLEKIAKEKKRLFKEGKIKKQKPLPEIGEGEEPFELPKGWMWTRFGVLVN
jgi:hypothetical protein